MSESPTTLPVVAFLGAGSMAGAIIAGLTRPGVEVEGIRTTNRSAEAAAAYAGRDGITAYATDEDADANRSAVAGAKLVVVAVKPAMVPDLLREIAGSLDEGAVVVSVAAGVTLDTFESILPAHVSVVRSMPNTPALVGRGVTGVAGGSRTGEEDLALAVALFETVGEVIVLPESQIDALSAISGSGPAYVFFLIEQLTATAVNLGFTPEQAALMVQGTFRGASELLAATGEEPAELRRRVTSPKGTTERAIAVFETAGFGQTFDSATAAAIARAAELAAGK
ncbi:pyrroline-5-carboxylate reductase [Agromyces seonyuensis]|uniref:Pyrroline-5-carboxylate reductase n=1 Tax=Agromyces seonyuensis TaxID=2662446 RepID=A0A6I4NY12_9MICO|nr:pyrroline-5-carboxylate reductase [Agromyces seonyuensis]MWB98042.1 pyrroline-5-carboxylate reductase [Agromyces seonyuensis]